jgi:hypothetical protein
MQIVNFRPGFHEVGKIKIGCAGEERTAKSGVKYNLPQKLDHFIVTTCEKQGANFKLDIIMAKLGEKPREIGIRLIFDSIEENFDTSYSYYSGHKCFCRGDGKAATRRKYAKEGKLIKLTGEEEKLACPCELLDPSEDGRGRCKPYGILMCVLEKAERVGGVYKFRTTSYNSIRGIMTSLAFIRQASGGILSGIPLWLTVSPRQVETPQGQKSLVHIVNIEYRGSLDELIAKGAEVAKVRSQSQVAMAEVRKSLRLISMVDTTEDEAAVAEEFHPEAMDEKVVDAEFERVEPDPEQPKKGQPYPEHEETMRIEEEAPLDLDDAPGPEALPPRPVNTPPKHKAEPTQPRPPAKSTPKSAGSW